MKRELSFLLAAAMAASLAGCAADIADADSSITALNDSATAELTSYNAADAVTLTFTDSGIAGGGSGVESGTITIDAEDDALHCDLVMNVGADGTDGPTITITNAYEGLEAATLNIASGNIDITCSDDCLNSASSLLTDYDFAMNISGGTIRAYTTAGDGFDSNGTMTISGGGIEVWTANTADNQPLDADGGIAVTGGTVLAAGGSSGMGMAITAEQAYVTFGSGRGGMGGGFGGGQRPDMSEQPADGERPELPDNADTQPDDAPSPPQGEIENAPQGVPDMDGEAATQQPPMMQTDDRTDSGSISLTAGDSFTITDADGNTIYSGTAVCNASYVFYSSTGLTADTTYTFVADTASVEATARIDTSSTGMEGGMGGQRPDGGRQQNADVLPADDTQKRSA